MKTWSATFDGLNAAQRHAVEHQTGPLLIIAGAGAGKTRVITHRILRLVEKGVAPEEILAVTFTNKAAREMRERTLELLRTNPHVSGTGTFPRSPFIATFHSLGVHILREHGHLIGLPRHFSILDRSESLSLVKSAMKTLDLNPKEIEPRRLLSYISRQKGKGLGQGSEESEVQREYRGQFMDDVWHVYEQLLKRERACDFDDLLLRTLTLLKRHPHVSSVYTSRWKYLHIDEYQDTNEVQNLIARELAGKEQNICVVGDLDQNIYSWRGADIENMLSFEREYPNTTTVALEQNYRSTKTIIEAANTIIEKNRRRRPKRLFTENSAGELITLYGGFDEADEARYISERAAKLIASGTPAREIAVLYRANFQSRALEEAFLMREVPYQVLGIRFFERKEVKDVIGYLRAALNPQSTTDLARIINMPPRGMGKVTLLKILEGKESSLRGRAADSWHTLKKTLADIATRCDSTKTSDLIKYVLTASGLERYYQEAGTEEDLERLENLREVVTLGARYDVLAPREGLEKFLEDVALSSEQDELDEERDAVKLMTVHASKGLEFDVVFVSGLEDGLFPHARNGEEKVDHEEERRLFYVALTRARKKLFLTFASLRTLFGSKNTTIPSEFLSDIDTRLIESEPGGHYSSEPKTVIYLD